MRHSMKTARRATWLIPVFVLAALPLGNCGTAEPPLDQLELRDALLSEPTVIAGLPREAQQRLAGRFWAAVPFVRLIWFSVTLIACACFQVSAVMIGGCSPG